MWKGSDTTVIDGTEEQYVYDKNESGNDYDDAPAAKFTGIGEGYYLTTSNTVTTANATGNGIYYSLSSCSSANSNEIIPITLSGASFVAKKGAVFPLNNLGNWGAQYQFNTTLDNSSSTTAKTFKCYIGRNAKEGKFVIKYGNQISYCSMGATTSSVGTAYKWNFIDVTVPAKSKQTVSFQLSHATCSSSPIYLQWKLG